MSWLWQAGGCFGGSVNPISTRGTLCPPHYYLPPPPDCLTFLRPWGSGLANFSYFFSTNFNLVAKKKKFVLGLSHQLSVRRLLLLYLLSSPPPLPLFLSSFPTFLFGGRPLRKRAPNGLKSFFNLHYVKLAAFPSGIPKPSTSILNRKVEKYQR